MKAFLLIVAGLLFAGIADMPIGFYTFLRIVVFIAAIVVIIQDYDAGFSFWMIAFILIAILFNPVIPVYLHDKETWTVLDAVTAILFIIKSFNLNTITK